MRIRWGMEPSVEPGGECAVACGNRVGVGFPEVVKLLHFYTEFLVSPNFYTFTMLAHFFSPRCARVLQSYKYKAHVSADFFGGRAQRGAGGAWRGAVGQQGVAAPAATRRDRTRVSGERHGGRGGVGVSFFSRLRRANFYTFTVIQQSCEYMYSHFYTFMAKFPNFYKTPTL